MSMTIILLLNDLFHLWSGVKMCSKDFILSFHNNIRKLANWQSSSDHYKGNVSLQSYRKHTTGYPIRPYSLGCFTMLHTKTALIVPARNLEFRVLDSYHNYICVSIIVKNIMHFVGLIFMKSQSKILKILRKKKLSTIISSV